MTRKTRRTMTAEEREEYERHIDETLALIEARRAYHRAKLAEEQEQQERWERSWRGRLSRRLSGRRAA